MILAESNNDNSLEQCGSIVAPCRPSLRAGRRGGPEEGRSLCGLPWPERQLPERGVPDPLPARLHATSTSNWSVRRGDAAAEGCGRRP